MSLGIATAGVAIQLNTVTAYRALFLANALSCLIAVAALGWLPRYEPLPGAREESPFTALKDRPFVAYTALSGAMYMQYLVLALLLPVWVVFHTNAPRWTVSAFVVINTLIVVLFQVRVGKTVQTIRQGGAAFRLAGVIFLVSCSAMGLAAGLPAWAALLLLAGAVVLHTCGELWQSSGMFALDFGLAPPHAQGQYQGLVSTACRGKGWRAMSKVAWCGPGCEAAVLEPGLGWLACADVPGGVCSGLFGRSCVCGIADRNEGRYGQSVSTGTVRGERGRGADAG
jgi:hypothetical protein